MKKEGYALAEALRDEAQNIRDDNRQQLVFDAAKEIENLVEENARLRQVAGEKVKVEPCGRKWQ